MLFQPGEPVGEKALAPKRNHFTAGVQAGRNLVVGEPLGGVEDHLGSLDLKIR